MSEIAQDRLKAAGADLRNILVHVEPDPAARPRLEAAAELARRLDARLIGVGAEAVQTFGIGDPTGLTDSAWIGDLAKLVEQDLARAEAAFREVAAGLNSVWYGLEAIPARAVAALSRGADLVVAGGGPVGPLDTRRACDPADLVLLCGRPVLVAPPRGGTLQASVALVAWNDTREARRALADSLPFLKSARVAVILEICSADSVRAAEQRTQEVVDALEQHGVRAQPKVLVASGDRVAVELEATAATIGADLIVAGAYGHSRLGEWAFGGVTRTLLRDPGRFLLLSH